MVLSWVKYVLLGTINITYNNKFNLKSLDRIEAKFNRFHFTFLTVNKVLYDKCIIPHGRTDKLICTNSISY